MSSGTKELKQLKETPIQKLMKHRKLIVEPVACILFFSVFLSAQVITNHLTYRVCISELNETEEVCRRLETKQDGLGSKDLEIRVQPFVANYNSYKVIIESLIPAIMSLFVGAWSDKHGRKIVIMISYTGFILQFFMFYLLGSISSPIKIYWYLLASLPVALSGGNCILLSTLMSYITDVSVEENRSRRVANFQVALITGIFLGSAFSGILNKNLKDTNIFLVSSFVLILGLLFILTQVIESVEISKNKGYGLDDLFRTDMIKQMIHTATRPRSDNDRTIIWLIVTNFALTMFLQEGSNILFFLYAREKFGWKLEDFSIFIIVATIVIIIGTQLGVRLKNKLNLSDSGTAISALITLILSNLINAIGTKSQHLYIAMIIGIFRGLPDTLNRSILATIVASNEMGKINSLIGSIQAMCSLGAAPLYSWIYKKTLETNPGAYFYLNALFFGIIALSFGSIHKMRGKINQNNDSRSKKTIKSN